jgi:hypothetical protein
MGGSQLGKFRPHPAPIECFKDEAALLADPNYRATKKAGAPEFPPRRPERLGYTSRLEVELRGELRNSARGSACD